jgi:hypothetical protein
VAQTEEGGLAHRGQTASDRGQTAFDRGQTAFDRGQTAFDRGQAAFDRGQTAFDRVRAGAASLLRLRREGGCAERNAAACGLTSRRLRTRFWNPGRCSNSWILLRLSTADFSGIGTRSARRLKPAALALSMIQISPIQASKFQGLGSWRQGLRFGVWTLRGSRRRSARPRHAPSASFFLHLNPTYAL